MSLETNTDNNKNTKEFESLLKDDLKKRNLKENTLVKAKITQIMPKFVLLDAGAKSDGLVSAEEFENFSSLKVGDTVDCLVERLEDYRSGNIVLSRRKAVLFQNWEKIREAHKKGTILDGVIKGRVRGGFLAIVEGSNCFLPGSAVSEHPLNPEQLGKLFNVPQKMKVVSVNEERMNCIVSMKEVYMKDKNEQLQNIIKKIKVGQTLENVCTVHAMNDWGVWVSISIDGSSAIAMTHVTQLSYERVRRPADILKVGQKIPKIKVLEIDNDSKPPRIALSLKALFPDPLDGIEKKYISGKTYKGKVVSIKSYGAFLELEPYVQALLHSSQMDFFDKSVNPNKKVKIGDEIDVRILEVKDRKISVSILSGENPFNAFSEKFPVGSIVNTEVFKVLEYGLMLKIDGAEIPPGICHWKSLSYKESESNLKKWKKGMKTKAKILMIDKDSAKIRLGIREASNEKDPFETIFGKLSEKDIITCTVKEVKKNAIVVAPGNEESLLTTIHKSQLGIKDVRLDIYNKNMRIDAMIVSLNKVERKAELSVKAFEEYNQKILEEKYGKDGSSSGQILGDILGKVFKSKAKKNKTSKKKEKK